MVVVMALVRFAFSLKILARHGVAICHVAASTALTAWPATLRVAERLDVEIEAF